jgi:hypothetical protein
MCLPLPLVIMFISSLALANLDGVSSVVVPPRLRGDSCAESGASRMHLKMLPSTGTPPTGAACLDGSPIGYYIDLTTNASHVNDWQLFFQGGGWCYSEIDCYGRSKTTLGSSKAWPQQQCEGGPMSSDCTQNPLLCQYNRVYLAYCDGNSFASNRADPVNVTGAGVPAATQIF